MYAEARLTCWELSKMEERAKPFRWRSSVTVSPISLRNLSFSSKHGGVRKELMPAGGPVREPRPVGKETLDKVQRGVSVLQDFMNYSDHVGDERVHTGV